MALTKQGIRALKPRGKPYKVRDGKHGLFVHVTANGSTTYGQRISLRGKRIELGMGSTDYMTLGDARRVALSNHALARQGIDPRKPVESAMTFRDAADEKFEVKCGEWKGGTDSKTAHDWLRRMDTYILPHLGDVPVAEVNNCQIRTVLMPVVGKPAVLKNVAQAIGAVLDWAIAMDHREAANRVQQVVAQLPRSATCRKVVHHKAVPYADLPKTIAAVNATSIMQAAKDALTILVLTACRGAEVLGMRWEEVDGDTWTVPADRMKGGRVHRVPLSGAALAILDRRRKRSGGELVFGGRNGQLAGKTLRNALGSAKVDATVHGMRSAFKDWARENGEDETASEFALAHVEGSATVAAYARSDLLDARRAMMERWALHCVPGKGTLDRFIND